MLTFEVTHNDHCRRLESFLRTLMPSASPGYCRKLIKNGAAKLNAAVATPDTLLAVNDRVTLKESAATTSLLSPTRPELDLLYEDDQVAMVNKPAGLPMHRTAEREANLVDAGMAYMAWRGTPCKLYPVNRLDRGTSGAVILAKSSSAAGMFGRQVKETGLDKLYLALVAEIPDESGVIAEPLDGKESETRYTVLLHGAGNALLAVTPISGRMHQIRRHLGMIGHPVLGDKRYGLGELPDYDGFALHSFRTVVVRPEAGPLTVCAPLPEGFWGLVERYLGEQPEAVVRRLDACLGGMDGM
ncbi:RluA family pseudouridine synthase [Geobacter sp. FeAm09]|uniref:pseudouridine synthase n=1 Tax=Geobacter sp. FeAm09 TaxID=2597769 RepID=UPI0011EFB486|nr:RluA family pseudouridine synthase [Geobacter sp. FeAm09]QEM67795.1 RluA family pseudouridine synthase [Geobacter sp. FeAm09]